MSQDLLIKTIGIEAYLFLSSVTKIDQSTLIQKNRDHFNLEVLPNKSKNTIINANQLNGIKQINLFFASVHNKLTDDGLFICFFETKEERKKRLLAKFPFGFNFVYFLFDSFFKRILTKLPLTRQLMFFITADRNKTLSKAEVLGRLVFCGFDIISEKEINNSQFIICKKFASEVKRKKIPNYGLLFKMKRIGFEGKPITVYKFRTMHRYAEYIQAYIYEQNNLRSGGKIMDDYRITGWGKLLRMFWVDELPMVYNLLKGELRLVGVRPLSEHYLSLYSKELRELRMKSKPGLIPPFYSDLPSSLSEIMSSEIKYLKAYQKAPFKTNCRYFLRAVNNIIFRKVRSN